MLRGTCAPWVNSDAVFPPEESPVIRPMYLEMESRRANNPKQLNKIP
jgi:hypothetical protein